MKILESAENYLETILVLRDKITNVRSIDIANELAFSKPSVSIAMKRLKENGYITIDADGYIHLTEEGQAIADRIYSRHQLISQCLMLLGVDEETALQDACRIEHVISEDSIQALRKHIEQNSK